MRATKRFLVKLRRAIRIYPIIAVFLTIFPPLMVAALSYSLFQAAGQSKYVGDLADQALATRMSILANTHKLRAGAHPIVFVNYDDFTAEMLNDPVLIPSEVTAKTLSTLADFRPWAVVVDIDVGYLMDKPDHNSRSEVGLLATWRGLDGLRRAIGDLASSGTTVILVRETLPSVDNPYKVRLRASALDDYVAKTPRVLWASATYAAEPNRVVRRIWPVQNATLNGEQVTIPSVPLVLKLLAMEGSSDQLDDLVSAGLARQASCGTNFEDTFIFCTRSGPFSVSGTTALPIDYTLKWPIPAEFYLPKIPDGGEGRPQTKLVSIHPFVFGDGWSDPGLFKDALVIVGATAARRDQRPTPVETMPGAYVIANAARDWVEFGPRRSSFYEGLGLVLMSTLILSSMLLAIRRLSNVLNRLPEASRAARIHGRIAPTLARMRGWIAPVLTGLLWAIFLAYGNPAVSVGLVVTAYVVVSSSVFFETFAMKLRRT